MIIPPDITTLTLTPDNPSNTTITSDTGDVLYNVYTDNTNQATVTQVRNTQDEVMASLEWNEVLPDKVIIGDSRPVWMTWWMKKSLVPYKDHLSFTDDQGRKYKWKGNSSGRSLELFTSEDDFTRPITRFRKSYRFLPTPTSPASEIQHTPATLSLDPRAVEIQDLVVISFLFIEKTRRMQDTSSNNTLNLMYGAGNTGSC